MDEIDNHSRRAEVSRAASFCRQGVTGTMPDLVLVVVEVDAPLMFYWYETMCAPNYGASCSQNAAYVHIKLGYLYVSISCRPRP
jgi:hypothetical protein